MATLRSPQNVYHATDAEILVSFSDRPDRIGLDGAFSDDWYTVGILNDGSTIDFNRTVERNKINGWGFGVVDTSAKPGEMTLTGEVLEDNDTVNRIAFPSVTEYDDIEGTISAKTVRHDDEVAKVYVAWVEKLSNGTTRIRCTRVPATATIENIVAGQEATGKTINFDLETDSYKRAFDEIVIDSAAAEDVNDNINMFGDGQIDVDESNSEAVENGTTDAPEDNTDTGASA